MSDTYATMTELYRNHPNKDDYMFEIGYRNSDTLITAVHGGGIEPGTTELALLTSEMIGANFFSFKGLKNKNNNELHVTSVNYDDPYLIRLGMSAQHTIAFHGFNGNKKMTYIGGKDKQLISLITQHLLTSGFAVKIAPYRISGKESANITNKNQRGVGVQLEISTEQRKVFFKNNDFSRDARENKENWNELFYQYVSAIKEAIKEIQ